MSRSSALKAMRKDLEAAEREHDAVKLAELRRLAEGLDEAELELLRRHRDTGEVWPDHASDEEDDRIVEVLERLASKGLARWVEKERESRDGLEYEYESYWKIRRRGRRALVEREAMIKAGGVT